MPVLLIWLGFSCLAMAYATYVMPSYPKYDETPMAAIQLAYVGVFVMGPIFIAWTLLGMVHDLVQLAKERP